MINRKTSSVWLTAAFAFALTSHANAASLKQVNNWGVSGLPSDVSMYIYVPDKVAAHPPVLALVHYCGGTAQAVFGQAQGGGLVKAADQYGFIMVVPSSGRCWDIVSNKTRTRDGGGDSHAIKQMVNYAIANYGGNADRVYSTGDSSGGMMTELLLAVYPDIFKAGSALAGMPAGCRGANESGNGGGYSNACAGGSVTHTAAEWGDIVRMMDPGYTGHRPRVQLFHGDADQTINYKNFTEAIKEWTNVVGLMTAPSMTDSGVTLGDHQANRQRWKNSCGFVTLDTFQSIGGDHGPSDALFKAEYIVPFLGLDKTTAKDPEIEQCGSQPGGGAGGASGSGGATAGTGGVAGVAGSNAHGGVSGIAGAGGADNGGTTSAAGSASGGTAVVASGGSTPSLAGSGSGGHASESGGAPSGSRAGGAAANPTDPPGASGCSCALKKNDEAGYGLLHGVTLGVVALMALRRRRRR